jgi:hypothetical protein
MRYILKTKRLSLRKLTLDDTEFIIDLVNSTGWIAIIEEKKYLINKD